MEGRLIRFPGRPPASSGGKTMRSGKHRPYPLKRFTLAYLGALAVWLGSKIAFIAILGFGNLVASFLIGIVIYLGCGIYLSRLISGNVAFNPNFANLASVARAKWRTVIGWPIAVAVLLVQMAAAKYL